MGGETSLRGVQEKAHRDRPASRCLLPPRREVTDESPDRGDHAMSGAECVSPGGSSTRSCRGRVGSAAETLKAVKVNTYDIVLLDIAFRMARAGRAAPDPNRLSSNALLLLSMYLKNNMRSAPCIWALPAT